MKIVLFANTDWYLYNFRLDFAKFLRARGHDVVMLSPPGRFGKRIEESGFEWIAVPMIRRSLNPFELAAGIARLTSLYRELKPDLVHHFTLQCIVAGSLAARAANVKAIVNAIAGYGFVFVSDRWLARVLRIGMKPLLRLACSRTNAMSIVQNADDLATFNYLRLAPPDHVRLVPGSGVDIQRFTPRDRPRREGPLRVLFVGRLLVDKGILEFVECARRCHDAAPGRFEFLAAGEADAGNPASVAPETIDAWRREGRVRFLDHVNDMPTLYRDADIAVLPSHGEGAPRSLIEAAACGLPLVASDVRGCREVVQPGYNGLLVPVHDVTALAAAVMRLGEDAALRTEMGQAGRHWVELRLQNRTVFERTLEVYAQAVTGTAALPGRKGLRQAI